MMLKSYLHLLTDLHCLQNEDHILQGLAPNLGLAYLLHCELLWVLQMHHFRLSGAFACTLCSF